jgi:uncharacterized delta-60 repeat protein
MPPPKTQVIRDVSPGFYCRSAAVLARTGGMFMTGLTESGHAFGVGKFISDGRPDPSFGTGGRVLLASVPRAGDPSDDRVVVQPDGRILVATSLFPQADGIFRTVLVRLHPNGAFDRSFNGDGASTVSFPGIAVRPSIAGVLLRPDGRIVIVISTSSHQLVVAQLLPNGDLDRAFGVEGKLQTVLPAQSTLHDATLDGAGNLLVGGAARRDDSGLDMVVARFRPDGSPDRTFGFSGTAFVDFGVGVADEAASKLLLQPDGTILVVGDARQAPSVSVPALARLTAAGTVDTRFGANGLVQVDLGKPQGAVHVGGAGRLSDGRIAVAGNYLVKSSGGAADPLARTLQPWVTVLQVDGSPDPSFNAGRVLFLSDLSDFNVRLTVEPNDQLLLLIDRAAVRIEAAKPKVSPLRLTIGATPNPATPGPLRFLVTVTNQATTPAGGVLRLRCTKSVGVENATLMAPTVSATKVEVLCKLRTVPPGGAATLTLRTTANGFEEGIELSGSIDTTDANGDPVTVRAATLVSTSRFPVI